VTLSNDNASQLARRGRFAQRNHYLPSTARLLFSVLYSILPHRRYSRLIWFDGTLFSLYLGRLQ
jgi:hypothetical protein